MGTGTVRPAAWCLSPAGGLTVAGWLLAVTGGYRQAPCDDRSMFVRWESIAVAK